MGWHPSEDTVTVGVAKRPIRNVQSTFDGDGKLITDFGGGNDFVRTVIVQQDGKIVAQDRPPAAPALPNSLWPVTTQMAPWTLHSTGMASYLSS